MTARVVLVVCLMHVPCLSSAGDFGGHVKAQLVADDYGTDEVGAALVGEHAELESLDARGNAAWRWGAWDVSVQMQLDLLRGDLLRVRHDARLSGAGATLLPVPDVTDRAQVFDLGWTLSDGDSHLLFGRLDRLSVGYTRGPLAVRAGRQASSWGGGLVFQVLDLLDPFPPNALDTEYKPGVDMVSAQWLFGNGDDLQTIVVPRRATRDAPLTASQSSAAVKLRHFAGSLELEILGARHYRDEIVGFGASGNLAGGVWRCDIAATFRDDGDAVLSGVFNLDRTWVVGGKNVEGYVEVFRNGFGVTSLDDGVEALPRPLLARLDRGELFNVGRHEVAGGARIEWSPLTTLEPTVLVNVDDASAYVLLQIHHEWRQDVDLAAGGQVPLGGHGTEYGGVRVAELDVYVAPPPTAWARVSWYF